MSSLALGDPQLLLPTGAPKAEQRVKAIDANPQGSSGSGNEQRTQGKGNQADPDGEGLFSVGSSGTMKSEGSNGGGNSMKNDSDVHSKNGTIGDGVFLTGAPPSPTERHPPANESKSPRSNIPRLPQRWGKASDADSQVLLGPRYGPQKPKESRGKKVPSNIRSRFGFVNKQRKLVSPKPTPSPAAAAAASSRKADSIGAVNKGPRQPRVKPLSMSPDDPRRQKRSGVDIWAVRSRALGEEGAVVGGSARAVREKRFKMPPSSTKSLGTLSSRAPVQRRRAADVPSYLRPTASTKLKAIAAFEQRKAVQEKEAALQLPPPGSGSPGNSPRAASLSPRVTSKRFTRAESPRHQRASQPSPDHSPVQFEKHSRTRQDDTDSVGSRGSRRSHHSHRSRRSHSRKHRHHHRHHDGHHHHHHRHSHSHSPRVPSSALSRPHDVERMEHNHYEHRITDAGVGGRYGIDHVAVEKSKGHVRSTSEPDSRFTAFAFTEDISDDDLLQEVDRYLATTTKDQLDTRSPSDHHDDAAQQPTHHSKHVKFQDPPVSHRVRVSPVRVKPEPPPKQQRLQQPPPSSERPRPFKLTERQKAQQRRDLLARRAKVSPTMALSASACGNRWLLVFAGSRFASSCSISKSSRNGAPCSTRS